MNDPKVGQYLWASCSAQNYGRILRVGTDANDTPVIDIEMAHPEDLLDSDEEENFPNPCLTSLDLTQEAKIALRDLQWRFFGESDGITIIECRTPGNGCFRCTKLFWLCDEDRSIEQ